MSNRSVVVTLRAEVAGFRSAMDSASQSARSTEQDLGRMSQNGTTSLGRLTTSATEHKEAWTAAGTALLGFGAAAAAGVGLAIKAYADFSAQMAQVQSLSHATGTDMESLTTAALTMGQGIGFSASEVAAGEIEMVKAGISVKDILGGAMVGALTLAAAGQIDVADATEIATIAMTQFNLTGKDVPHVADLLAAGADKALGGVSELGWALKSGGLVAHQFGLSLDDTVGTLALFAQNGLMGEAAGTDLRQMLLKLAAPSKSATADMQKLGLVLYDSSGHFVGITSLAGQLHDKMQNLSEAERNAMEAHIFGARSIVGANILYQAGAAGVQGWIDSVNDSGFAAKQAAGKMDSLSGDMKKLQAAWETGMIEMGSTADGFLRPVIQGVTNLVRGFDQLPEPMKGVILDFGAVAGATALAAGGFLTVVPRVLDTITGFKQLVKDGSQIPGLLGKIGKAAGLAAAGFAAFEALNALTFSQKATSVSELTNAVVDFSNAANKADTSKLDIAFTNWAQNGPVKGALGNINSMADAIARITHPQSGDGFARWGDQLFAWTGVAKSDTTQIDEKLGKLGETMGNLVNSGNAQAAATTFSALSKEFEKNGSNAQDALNHLPAYRDALLAQANAAKVSLEPQELLNYAMGQVPEKMLAAGDAVGVYTTTTGEAAPLTKEMADALDKIGLSADGVITDMAKLVTAMEQAGLLQISATQALSDYYAALDAVDASIKKNGTSLDLHTEKGRANQKALDDVAAAGLKVVDTNAKNGASQEELGKNLHTTYDDLLANYKAFGITGDQADTMARQVLGIPKGVSIDTAIQNYADSMLKLDGIGQKADAISGHRAIVIDVSLNANGAIANYDNLVQQTRAGQPIALATGGTVGHAASYFEGGGPVNYLAGGGLPSVGFAMVPRGTDIVPAMLTPDEFVVSRGPSLANRPILEAINNGAVYRPAPVYTGTPVGGSGGRGGGGQGLMTMVGTLTMDSGQVLGTFRGIARAEVNAGFDASNDDAGRRPSR